MDISGLVYLVNTLGFPIFVAMILFYQNYVICSRMEQSVNKLAESVHDFRMEFLLKINQTIEESVKREIRKNYERTHED